MILKSHISGNVVIETTVRVTIVAVDAEKNRVIISAMGEQHSLREGADFDLVVSGLYDIKGGE